MNPMLTWIGLEHDDGSRTHVRGDTIMAVSDGSVITTTEVVPHVDTAEEVLKHLGDALGVDWGKLPFMSVETTQRDVTWVLVPGIIAVCESIVPTRCSVRMGGGSEVVVPLPAVEFFQHIEAWQQKRAARSKLAL